MQQNMVGQIKINILENGQQEILITGDIPNKFILKVRRPLLIAYRKHVGELRRTLPKAVISSPGKMVAELSKSEVDKMNNNKANPDNGLKMPPTPGIVIQDQFVPDGDDVEVEEANNPNESEEKKDGTIEEAGRVHRDDEEQGGAGSTFGFDK